MSLLCTNGHKCIHRRWFTLKISCCHYILDTGKPRGYEIEDCPYWKDKKIEIDCRRIKLPGSFETIPTDTESED